MLYAGKSRRDIAGYDDAFMSWVLCRRRDEHGGLVRSNTDLPGWVLDNLDSKGQWKVKNPRTYSSVFNEVLEKQGFDEEARKAAWAIWRQNNPKFGSGG